VNDYAKAMSNAERQKRWRERVFFGSSRGFAFVICGLPYEQLTETERAQLAAEQQQHECEHDPPDAIERFLAREIAKLKGEPDPYGCDGLSEAERRVRDWGDWHEKQRRHLEEQAQEEDRPQYGLRELLASDTMSTGNREHEQEQPP
jgi:hypothetical protein